MIRDIVWLVSLGLFMGLSRCLVIYTDFRHKPWKRVYNCSLMYFAIIFALCSPQVLKGNWTLRHASGLVVMIAIGEVIAWLYWRWLNPPG